MLIAEKFALVAINPAKGKPQMIQRNFEAAGIATLLVAELALLGAIEVEGSKALVRDADVVDPLLLQVAESIRARHALRIQDQIRKMSLDIGGAWHAITSRLEADGILSKVKRARRPFFQASYSVEGVALREATLAQISAAAQSPGTDAESECLLIALHPCNLDKIVFPKRKLRRAVKPRLRGKPNYALTGASCGAVLRTLQHEWAQIITRDPL